MRSPVTSTGEALYWVLAAFLILLTSFTSDFLIAQDLEIVNIRVGQGDATLIQGPVDGTGNRVNVLIDAGDIPERDGGNILRAVLAKRKVKKLDFLIVTHYDADHIGGIASGESHGVGFLLGFNGVPGAVGDDDNDGNIDWIGDPFFKPDPDELGTDDDLEVGMFVDRGDDKTPTTQAFQKYHDMVTANGNRTSLNTLDEVENFEIDLGNGAKMIALSANGFVRDKPNQVRWVNTENEKSLSFLLTYNKFDFLISGDLTGRKHGGENAEVEAAVGEYIKSRNITVDILHVNHHGANNGSDSDFLESIQPTIAIISAGNGNTHKHPHNSVLRRLDKALVYRIIQTSWGSTSAKMPNTVRKIQSIYQSDVILSTDGNHYTISTTRTFKTDENPRRAN